MSVRTLEGDSVYVLLECTLSLVLRGFVAVYLTLAQFSLRLKFCFYTIVHLILEEFRFSLKSSLSTQSVHITSWSRQSRFLGPESRVPQKLSTLHCWSQM